MTATRSTRHDVVVVGSRCAGAATAMLLARAGHDVVLVDRSPQLGDVLSTHGIARGGVVQLSRWGLLDAVLATGAPPARQVTFGIDTTLTVRRIKDRAGVDMLLAPRRHVLDALLADAARAAGADVRLGLSVTDVIRDRDGRVAGVAAQARRGATTHIRALHVAGAFGRRSRGLSGQTSSRVTTATRPCITHTSPRRTGTASSFISRSRPSPGSSRLTTDRAACGCAGRPGCCARSATPAPAGQRRCSA